MLASATEVEVELHVPEDVSTFFGVTWAQDPRKDKVIMIRAVYFLLYFYQYYYCRSYMILLSTCIATLLLLLYGI